MNQARKQKVWEIEVALTGLMPKVKEIYDAEQDSFDELPIAIQESEAGKKNEERIQDLEDLTLQIQESMALAGKIINNSKGDVHDHHTD